MIAQEELEAPRLIITQTLKPLIRFIYVIFFKEWLLMRTLEMEPRASVGEGVDHRALGSIAAGWGQDHEALGPHPCMPGRIVMKF